MKFILAIILVSISLNASSQIGRTSTLFNDNWKFHRGEASNAEKVIFDDSSWKQLSLPHDWSIESPFDAKWASGTGFLPGGIGWYRKTFKMAPAMNSKKVFLYFDGVYKNSEVWINGNFLGKRPSGFASFQYEITKYLNKNGKNIVAVKADHSDFADSRWYTGSGIYRNVYLVATDPVHIDQWGVQFSTPRVDEKSAAAHINVSVLNQTGAPKTVRVTAMLTNSKGKAIGTSKDITLSKDAKGTATMDFTIANPLLWSVDHPELYKLEVSVLSNGKKIDGVTDQVGIRYYKFDKDKGFSLNGKSMKLKGLCIHDDAGALGTAVPEEVWERRLKILKEGGCNAIRLSHNPHADYLYKLMDKLGFLVMDEAFDEWEFAKNKWIEGWNVGKPGKDGYFTYFEEWGERDLTDMVLRNFNRPSIILWSIGNEVDYPNDPYSHEVLNTGNNPQIYGKGYLPANPPASRITGIARRLVAVVKKYDTSRPVTTAFAGVVMSNAVGAPEMMDLAGYNYQEFRYADDHAKYPERIIYGSENGHAYSAWKAVADNEYISGQFLWTGIDYMGEAGRWPSRSNQAGLIDLAGFPKTEYYFRQSLWSEKPMVYLGTSRVAGRNAAPGNKRGIVPHWNYQVGDTVRVSAFTNQTEAELFLNGISQGRKAAKDATDGVLNWSVLYQPGELSIKGFTGTATTAAQSLKTSSDAIALQVIADNRVLSPKGVAHVEINVTDKDGTIVYLADQEITIDLEGPVKLLGLESGSLVSHENYKANKRKVFHGKLMAYIQAGQKPGVIKIRIRAAGLKEQVLNLEVK